MIKDDGKEEDMYEDLRDDEEGILFNNNTCILKPL